jgi:hypothetical protein
MACDPQCSPTLTPLVLESCTASFLKGGWYKWGFMKCDADFDDVTGGTITDVSRWAEMIEANDIIISGPLLGAKGEASVTSLRINSCQPEIPVGGTMTFTFEDYNAVAETFEHITWWRQIQTNYNALVFLAISCEGNVYRYENGLWSINASEVRETASETPTKIAGTITVAEYLLTVPAYVEGLIGLI